MPRIDRFLEFTTWGELHEDTQEYIKNNLLDVANTYMYNLDNDYLEETGGDLYPVAFLKNGMYLKVDRVDVWSCNTGGGVYIDFNDSERFEKL